MDELLIQYDKEMDVHKRGAILRELDGIVTARHNYLLEWYGPFQRMVYWNKFGQPKGVITRIGDYRDPTRLWWIDPEKNRKLEEALRDPSKKLEAGPSEDRYWLDFAKVEQQQNPAQSGK